MPKQDRPTLSLVIPGSTSDYQCPVPKTFREFTPASPARPDPPENYPYASASPDSFANPFKPRSPVDTLDGMESIPVEPIGRLPPPLPHKDFAVTGLEPRNDINGINLGALNSHGDTVPSHTTNTVVGNREPDPEANGVKKDPLGPWWRSSDFLYIVVLPVGFLAGLAILLGFVLPR